MQSNSLTSICFCIAPIFCLLQEQLLVGLFIACVYAIELPPLLEIERHAIVI